MIEQQEESDEEKGRIVLSKLNKRSAANIKRKINNNDETLFDLILFALDMVARYSTKRNIFNVCTHCIQYSVLYLSQDGWRKKKMARELTHLRNV